MAQEEIGPQTNLMGLTIESYTVAAWCPTQDGSGPATAVALELKVNELPPLYMRLGSPRAVDELVALLQRYKGEVWR